MGATVWIATPTHSGQLQARYVISMLQAIQVLNSAGHQANLDFVEGQALIQVARNHMAHQFLASNATHLLTFDADQALATPDAIAKMVELDLPIVGLPVAQKNINWDAIAAAARAGVPVSDLPLCGSTFAVNFLDNRLQTDHRSVGEVQTLGTGCMLVQRRVFETIKQAYPDRWYSSTFPQTLGQRVYIFYEPYIHAQDRIYRAEDYAFCELARSCGFKVYLYIGGAVVHFGNHAYMGEIGKSMAHQS